MKLSWTSDEDHPTIERLTVKRYGLRYIVPGYTRHETDDIGKRADEEAFLHTINRDEE